MTTTQTTARSSGGRAASTIEQLRGLHDAEVTVRTIRGAFTGTVLSCTRASVWLISGDEDVVVSIDEIVSVRPTHDAAA